MSKRFVHPALFGPWCLVLLIWQLTVPAPAQAQAKVMPAPVPKRVLLLYTYGDGLPGYQKATPAFISVMTAGGIDINDLFFEYLDLQRNKNAEYKQRLADLLRYKYAMHQIGLIVTVHTAALNFLLDEGKGLFPDAPVVSYLIVEPELIEAKNTGRRILQRPQSLDMRGTLEIALRMFPDTRKIVFVTGTADGDRRLEREANRIFEAWRDKLEFQYTSDRSVEEILQLVASLPPRSIVIYNNVFSDTTGRTFIPREVGKMVAKAANAPVFCLWDTLIGSGVIGGSLLSFEAEGAYAANMVLDILSGKILLTKPVTTLPTSKTYMFDCQQLNRWGVNENRLPPGSNVLNRPKTIWSEYQGFVIAGIAVLLAQTLLLIGLLVQRRLKKKAESSVREKTEELDQFFNVSTDLLCVANTDGYFLRLNPVWERTFGYSREELMAKRFLDFVHPDDLDRTRDVISYLASQQKVFSFQNRYRCKDGTYRWLEWSSAPAGNLIYAAARDVTEHHRAEEDLKKSEERFRMLVETMKEGFGARNENYVWTYANDQLCWMLGLLPGDIIGRPIAEFLDEANQGVLRKVIQEQKKGNYSPYEMTWTRTDGRKVTTIVSPKPIFNPEGQIKEVFAVITDITERKRVEEALQESKEEAQRVAREALVRAEVGRIISSTLTIEEVYEPFAAVVKRIIPFDRIVINTIDSEKGTFENAYMAGVEIGDRETGKVHTLEGSGMAEMVRTKSPFLLQTEDFTDYQERFPMLLSTFQAGFRSILNVPLVTQGRIIGGLLLRSFKPRAYTDEHVQLAQRIGNQIAGAIANAQLFLKQRRAEEALRESEDRFRQVAESVGDFIWEVDANGLYRYTSPSVETILGYRPDELIGKKYFYDLFAPEVREELKAAALTALAGKQPFRAFPNLNVTKEGRVVQLETSGLPILDAGGNLVGYRGADTDVSERKRSEKALAESQAQILALFNSTNDMIWSVDPETFGLVTFNKGLKDYFFNWQGLEIKAGMTPERLLPPEYAVKWREFYTRALREGSYVEEYTVADGTKTLLLSINPLRRDGNIFGISVFGRDVTDRKLAEQTIEERLRFEQLLSGLSARFVNVLPGQVDPEINHALRQLLEYFQVDRCALLQTLQDKTSWQVTHAAYSDDVPAVFIGVELPRSLTPWTYEKLTEKREVLSFSRLDDLPGEASVDRQTYMEWGIRSNLNIPIIVGEPVVHVIVINSVKNERAWPEEYVQRLRLVGEILVNALERKQIRLQIEERLRFEGLISDLSAAFVNLPPDEVDSQINNGLRSITEFFDADRCSIGLFSKDGTRLVLAFEYRSAEAEPARESLSKEQMPWYLEQLIQGNPVVINRVEDLPPEAEKERQLCLAMGMKSVLSIPMLSGGKTLGACALVSTRAERLWPEEFIPRLRLLGEILVNVTEHKRAEVEVHRARTQLLHVERSARMGELTASLAHELNQPLAAILSNAQAALRFLKSDKPDLNEFQEIMQDIISDDQRAGNVIRSLRSMMKREERERTPVILNNVLNDVTQILHTESIFRNVHIDTEFDESLPTVLGDKVQLQQVALNLIVNAADAMSQIPPECRKIILRTRVKDDRIRVTIRDFGPGIDQGNLDRIFQPFFTTKGTGLGMGLAVSQTIVEAHGGYIWAENNPDGGATFFIELPVVSDR